MVESCAVVTTEPNALMAEIHDRMPVVVAPAEPDVRLHGTADEARHILRPYDPGEMTAWEVAAGVGNVRDDGPECVAPLAA